jgi:hypothetical protein
MLFTNTVPSLVDPLGIAQICHLKMLIGVTLCLTVVACNCCAAVAFEHLQGCDMDYFL